MKFSLIASSAMAISLERGEMQIVPDYFDRDLDEPKQNQFDGLYHLSSGKVVDANDKEVKMSDNIALMTQFIEDYDNDISKIQFQGTPIALVEKKVA